jgi:hypothetical protein
MKISEIRKLIYEEIMTVLQDDAIFSDRASPGIVQQREVPGDDNTGRNLSYGNVKSTDSEGRDAKKNLYYIFTKAQSLHDMLNDEDDLPPWAQSKIARVAEKISAVYDYLDYKIHTDDY